MIVVVVVSYCDDSNSRSTVIVVVVVVVSYCDDSSRRSTVMVVVAGLL